MENKVVVIPPTKSMDVPDKQLQVAAYCRVSTGHLEQEQSLDAQIAHYTSHIASNPDWIGAGVFSDTGSGLRAKSRTGLQTLLRRCRKGKVDLVLTKSVSRLGRNRVEVLRILDELRERGVDIWFETNALRLSDPDARLLLEVYTGFAQAESEVKSGSIRWGLYQSFQSGQGKRSNTVCYGYEQDGDGNLVPSPFHSHIVRYIFHSYLAGYSLRDICGLLQGLGLRSPTGAKDWHHETVRGILTNEKYMGNVLHQKAYVTDVLTGHRRRNCGERDRYLLSSHNEPIVGKDVYQQVQILLKEKRRNAENQPEG